MPLHLLFTALAIADPFKPLIDMVLSLARDLQSGVDAAIVPVVSLATELLLFRTMFKKPSWEKFGGIVLVGMVAAFSMGATTGLVGGAKSTGSQIGNSVGGGVTAANTAPASTPQGG